MISMGFYLPYGIFFWNRLSRVVGTHCCRLVEVNLRLGGWKAAMGVWEGVRRRGR